MTIDYYAPPDPMPAVEVSRPPEPPLEKGPFYVNPWGRVGHGDIPVTVAFLEEQVKNYERVEPTGRKRATVIEREAIAGYEAELPAAVQREKEAKATVDALVEPKRTGQGAIDEGVTTGREMARREWGRAALALDRIRDAIAVLKNAIENNKRPNPEGEPIEVKHARRLIMQHYATAKANGYGNGDGK